MTQSEKFDKKGIYKKIYSRINSFNQKFIHCPWEAPNSVLLDAGIKLEKHIPLIVDLKVSRLKALKPLTL